MKTKFIFGISLILAGISSSLYAQQDFDVNIVPSGITAMPAIHSFSFANRNGKWIFIGGRTNGLHEFQPPFAFLPSGINDSVFVIDPIANQWWASSANVLADSIREPVTSTNMESFQNDSVLYMIGGYGWQNSSSNFISFPTLTAINLDGLMNAVINNTSIVPYFRQLTDTNFAIAGGHLEKIDSVYQLVFGHHFDGYYSISDSSAAFYQKYSNEVRRFQIMDDGTNFSVYNYSAISDTLNFHRRDYNLVPQIFPNNEYGLTAFSGVFRYHRLLPYTSSVDIISSGASVNASFSQLYSNYDCATMPVFDSAANYMHTVFFGGMSMYYPDSVTFIQTYDSLVPFVNTISRVERRPDGTMHEYALHNHMPGLLGTDALFIPNDSLPMRYGRILDLNLMDSITRAGYIVGGMRSPFPNVSSIATLSSANPVVYSVYLTKMPPSTVSVEEVKTNFSDFIAYPNPSSKEIYFEFILKKKCTVAVQLMDVKGSQVATPLKSTLMDGGSHTVSLSTEGLVAGTYFCRMICDGKSIVQKLVITTSSK